MIRITVSNSHQNRQLEHAAGLLEIGRGPARDVSRLVVLDEHVSRDQLSLEELPDGQLRVKNISRRTHVRLDAGRSIAPGGDGCLLLPVRLRIGHTHVIVEPCDEEILDPNTLHTIAGPMQTTASSKARPLRELGEAPAPETVAHWLETVIGLQRSSADGPEFHQGAARALVELVGLDLGMVLLRHDEAWTVAACKTANPNVETRYSRTLVHHVCREKRTFFQDVSGLSIQSESMSAIDTAVVSPIFGPNDQVTGVLYGARSWRAAGRTVIRPLEAQVVQLLASAVGAFLARAAEARTRALFEQFFSPELVRELERHPDLLEGRDQDVTILASDLRGFTTIVERTDARTTCQLVRDLMERLTERIAEQGGVIVDYAGDGILAMWNAPVPQADHPVRACRAALAMLGELPGINDRWQKVIGVSLRLGIGINTGPARVGNTGSSRKLKYGPHGHTVNIASRVQAATKDLAVPLLITDATRACLGDGWKANRVGQIELPGVAEAAGLHELTGVGDSRS